MVYASPHLDFEFNHVTWVAKGKLSGSKNVCVQLGYDLFNSDIFIIKAFLDSFCFSARTKEWTHIQHMQRTCVPPLLRRPTQIHSLNQASSHVQLAPANAQTHKPNEFLGLRFCSSQWDIIVALYNQYTAFPWFLFITWGAIILISRY